MVSSPSSVAVTTSALVALVKVTDLMLRERSDMSIPDSIPARNSLPVSPQPMP